jgi:hypothetical protein
MISLSQLIKKGTPMKHLFSKPLLTLLTASVLLSGCASTDPYSPQSNDDFIYDNDMSFAMNVIDGSLGFHNGLRDSKLPEKSSNTPGALDYAADGIIGAAFGGGIGGAFLSMLGTNHANEPLHSYYGLVYYPVKQKGNVQAIFDSIEKELITTAENTRRLKFSKKSKNKSGNTLLNFIGEDCSTHQGLMGHKREDTCNFIHHSPPKLIKYTTVNPNGEQGLYAVIGYEEFFTATYLWFDLDEKYYSFSPVIRGRTKFPFVVNNQKIFPFIKPSQGTDKESLSIEQLMAVDPWVNKHYGAVKN